MTNHVYRVEVPRESASVLLRVYGKTGGLFEREADGRNYGLVHSVGLAPKLVAAFEGGRVEQYLEEFRALRCCDMRQPQISKQIAAKLAEFHFLTVR